jgi:phosphate transport system protein
LAPHDCKTSITGSTPVAASNIPPANGHFPVVRDRAHNFRFSRTADILPTRHGSIGEYREIRGGTLRPRRSGVYVSARLTMERSMPMGSEIRDLFHVQLEELERQAMSAMDLVGGQLEQALRAVTQRDVALAQMVVAADEGVNRRCLAVHQGVLELLARRTPVAGDLRLVAAVLHIAWCLERIGDQCVNIAKLVPLSGFESPRDARILSAIGRMGRQVRLQIVQAKETFLSRDIELAEDLALQDAEVDKLNRDVFRRAVEIGGDIEMREWATFMVLVARALERIGDNTVYVAEQTVFLATGLLKELADTPHSGLVGDESGPT